MTKEEAARLVGRQPKTCLKNMALALSLYSWNNTPEEWTRLEAAIVHLGRSAPPRARAVLKRHLEALAYEPIEPAGWEGGFARNH